MGKKRIDLSFTVYSGKWRNTGRVGYKLEFEPALCGEVDGRPLDPCTSIDDVLHCAKRMVEHNNIRSLHVGFECVNSVDTERLNYELGKYAKSRGLPYSFSIDESLKDSEK
jgi:hypothetical protein